MLAKTAVKTAAKRASIPPQIAKKWQFDTEGMSFCGKLARN